MGEGFSHFLAKVLSRASQPKNKQVPHSHRGGGKETYLPGNQGQGQIMDTVFVSSKELKTQFFLKKALHVSK